MAEFFKINIYIYICIYISCFVPCQNTKKVKFMFYYRDYTGEFYLNFTLNKGNVIEKYFYEKVKADEGFRLYLMRNNYGGLKDFRITMGNNIITNFVDEGANKRYNAGDIILLFKNGNYYVIFLCADATLSSAQKVGDIEESSLDVFNSLNDRLSNGYTIYPNLKLIKPEQSESILTKIIVVIVVVISITLLLIIYLLIQF